MSDYENYETVTSVTDGENGEKKPTNGFAIAGMVIGILSIPSSCCFAIVGVIIGIAGLIFSIVAQTKGKSGMGLAGIICSIVGIVFGIINGIAGAVLVSSGMFPMY